MADKKRRTGSNPLNSFLSHIPDYTEKEDDSEQSKAKSKTDSESKTKAKPKTQVKTKPESKTKAESKTKPNVKTEPETKSKAETKTIAKQESESQTETKTEPETISEAQTFPQAKTFASDIKERAAAQSELQRFEDNRKRQTYWLDHNTIAMISELAERSGCNKYHVVSAGVQMLYEYVFESTDDKELQ